MIRLLFLLLAFIGSVEGASTLEKEIKPNEEKKTPEPNKDFPHPQPMQGRNCFDCPETDKDLLKGAIEDLQTEVASLKDEIQSLKDELQTTNDNLTAVQEMPSEESEALSNFLATGTAYAFYRLPTHGNENFGVVLDPVFLWRYGDALLFELKLDLAVSRCFTDLTVVYGVIDWVFSDEWIFRAGKFSTPLGLVWEKMTTGWINKLPNLPLPYVPRARVLTPPAEIGFNFRGAVPICYRDNGVPIVVSYDLWVSNGPDEEDDDIRLGCNTLDNNHCPGFGGRFAFRPWPYREIGFSGMWGQWNSNHHADIFAVRRNLYYNAGVIDLNWRIGGRAKVMGELIYTGRNAIKGFNIDHHFIHELGAWIQYSSFFFDPGCDDFWSKLEGVIRYSAVESERHHASGKQLSLGLNYHIFPTLIAKISYDFNAGKRDPYNKFWFQTAYAY
jgi:hypothetical protein